MRLISSSAVLIFLQYFNNHFDILLDAFKDDNQVSNNGISQDQIMSMNNKDGAANQIDLDYPWVIYRLRPSQLNEQQ